VFLVVFSLCLVLGIIVHSEKLNRYCPTKTSYISDGVKRTGFIRQCTRWKGKAAQWCNKRRSDRSQVDVGGTNYQWAKKKLSRQRGDGLRKLNKKGTVGRNDSTQSRKRPERTTDCSRTPSKLLNRKKQEDRKNEMRGKFLWNRSESAREGENWMFEPRTMGSELCRSTVSFPLRLAFIGLVTGKT